MCGHVHVCASVYCACIWRLWWFEQVWPNRLTHLNVWPVGMVLLGGMALMEGVLALLEEVCPCEGRL